MSSLPGGVIASAAVVTASVCNASRPPRLAPRPMQSGNPTADTTTPMLQFGERQPTNVVGHDKFCQRCRVTGEAVSEFENDAPHVPKVTERTR